MKPPPNPPPPLRTPDDLARWFTDGGANHDNLDPVSRIEVLQVLDYLASHLPGLPIATRRAAELAAAIRVRGLATEFSASVATSGTDIGTVAFRYGHESIPETVGDRVRNLVVEVIHESMFRRSSQVRTPHVQDR